MEDKKIPATCLTCYHAADAEADRSKQRCHQNFKLKNSTDTCKKYEYDPVRDRR